MGAPEIRLRRPTEEDAEGLLPLWRSPEVRRYLGGPCDEAGARERFEDLLATWREHGFGYEVVEVEGRPGPAGLCGFAHADYEPERPIELAYMFFPDVWGTGVARAAAELALARRAEFGITDPVAMAQLENVRSRRLLMRLGFEETEVVVRFGERQQRFRLPPTAAGVADTQP